MVRDAVVMEQGGGMRLEVWPRDLHLVHPWAVAGSRPGGRTVSPTVLVRLSDGHGVTGLGESAPSTRYGETRETSLGFLRSVDPDRLDAEDLPGTLAYLDDLAPGHLSAKGAVEVALQDLAATRAGVPLHQHLGLGFEEGRHVSSFSIGLGSPEEVRAKAAAAATFPVLKLKLGGAHDAACLAAVRDAAPDAVVRVDANEAWATREEALRRLEELAGEPAVELVEQPMPAATSPADWRWLRARSPLPLMADESCCSVRDVAALEGCVDAVNVKLCKTAGLTGAIALLTAARAAGMATMLGCMIESSVLISAAAHLAELTDHLDLDGNLLISDDPYRGVANHCGLLSFADAPRSTGLCVAERD